MKPFTINGRNYTELWAWLPVKTTRGERLWMTRYYIRPGRNGEGIILSQWDLMLDY
jgi:hypothetical protein